MRPFVAPDNAAVRDELERLLGKMTLAAEILKEALELTRSKKLWLRSNWPGGGDFK